MDILEGLLLFAVCLFAAYKLLKLYWPIFEQRKNLTPIQMLERVIKAGDKDKAREATVFGSRRRTLVISIGNIVLLFGWLALARFPMLFFCIFCYQCIGHIVIYLVRIQLTPEPRNLGFNNRVFLRIFYAWFWPMYLAHGRR